MASLVVVGFSRAVAVTDKIDLVVVDYLAWWCKMGPHVFHGQNIRVELHIVAFTVLE